MSDQMAMRYCGGCGASNTAEARFCGACGQALLDTPSSNAPQFSVDGGWDALPLVARKLEVAPFAPGEDGPETSGSAERERAGSAEATAEAQVAQKRCGWCSQLNPWVSVVCEHCGAHFPIPEQDAAFRRAAEERMRQDMESLNFRLLHRRKGWRRFLL